jgi:VWFA-related protein
MLYPQALRCYANRSVTLLLSVVAVTMLGTSPLAQQQAPVFRTGVDLVQLDVVVTDKDGRPVTDLRQEDFTITEQGRAQSIAAFDAVSIPSVRRAEPNDTDIHPIVDVISNARPVDSRQWVLVLDDLHLLETNIVPTQRVVREFLLSLPPTDRVAVVFTGRSDLSLDFTSDLGTLLRVVGRFRDALGFAPDATNGQPWRDRARLAGATAHVLANIGTSLIDSSHPRKAIVYVGDGMAYGRQDIHFSSRNQPPTEVMAIRDVFTQLDLMMEGLKKAGVPLYTLDPRGVVDCNAVRGPCGTPPYGNIRRQVTMLQEFAENTGGRAFVNRSDTLGAVQQLIEDNNHYYLLGYYPSTTRKPGSFQEVRVRVNRPGVQVRARAGYIVPDPADVAAPAPGQALSRVLTSAALATGLDMRATASVVAVGERGMTIAVTAEVAYPRTGRAQEEDTVNDDIEFAVVALDHDGRVRGESRRTFQFSATPGDGPVSLLINDLMDVPGEPVTVRLGVISRSTDRHGSVHLPVVASPPDRSDVMFGGIMIGRADSGPAAAVLSELPAAAVPIQPLTSRVFEASDVLRVWVPVFWRHDTDAVPTVILRVRRADAVVTQHAASISPSTTTRGISAAGAGLDLSLSSLAPGRYLLEAEALLHGGAPQTIAITFDVAQR